MGLRTIGWLLSARQSLDSAIILVKNNFLDTPMLHTYDCARKALKGFLVFYSVPVKKTHNLVVLLELCFEFDPEIWKFFKHVTRLTPYATEFRYPDDVMFPEQEDVDQAIIDAQEIYDYVESKIT